jgi:RimJ/RimL family protein N-acetyltransferase
MPLRILTPEDAQAFRELRIETITNDPWGFGWTIEEMRATPLATFARRLSPGDSGDDFVLGLEEEGRLRGCAGFEREPRTRCRHRGLVWGVYLAPELRGSGMGRRLMEELIRKASALPGLEQIKLRVVPRQEPARALYRSLGFVLCGTEPQVFKSGDTYDDVETWVLPLRAG